MSGARPRARPSSPDSPSRRTLLPARPSGAFWRARASGTRTSTKVFVESDRAFIDAFAVLSEPYQPVVFDSLMRPIAEEWGDRSKTADGREEFWRWRRARSLPEFMPAAPAVRRAMVRGWFTASILGQITFDDLAVKIFVPNPVGGKGKWASFPNPPLAAGITATHDYLPLALESFPLRSSTWQSRQGSNRWSLQAASRNRHQWRRRPGELRVVEQGAQGLDRRGRSAPGCTESSRGSRGRGGRHVGGTAQRSPAEGRRHSRGSTTSCSATRNSGPNSSWHVHMSLRPTYWAV